MSRHIKCNHSSRVSWKTTRGTRALRLYRYDVPKPSVRGTFVQPRLLTRVCTGSEIYVGCSNGELLRFALQADDPNKVCLLTVRLAKARLMFSQLESYSLLSRQSMPNEKPIDEIVLVPSIARALILSGTSLLCCREASLNSTDHPSFLDHQVHFYTLPSLDPVPWNIIKPIRNVITIAVDHQHLQRPPSLSDPSSAVAPIEFCIIKRSNIALYSLRDKLLYQKVTVLPTYQAST
jgi:vacuolar protein sorting-associated protein 3